MVERYQIRLYENDELVDDFVEVNHASVSLFSMVLKCSSVDKLRVSKLNLYSDIMLPINIKIQRDTHIIYFL